MSLEGVDVVVLDARSRQSLVCVRSLGRAGLRVAAVDCAPAAAFASRWCSGTAVVPDFDRHPERFADAILGLLQGCKGAVLIPAHDGSIEALRPRRTDIEGLASLALASEPAFAIAVDKSKTLALAHRLGIRVPRGVMVSAGCEMERALRETGYPAVLKPVQSWVSRQGLGTRVAASLVANLREAMDVFARLVDAGGEVLVQEWLPGPRHAVSLMRAGGLVRARFAQLALRTFPPLGGSSVLRESVPLPTEAANAADELAAAMDLEGYAEVEFRGDRSGRPVLMEVNPRLSASVEVAVRSGVDFPRLLYAWAAGERVPEPGAYRLGVRMRWLGGELRYLRSAMSEGGRPDVTTPARAIFDFVRDSARPTAYDYLDRRDLAPAVQAIRQAFLR